MSILSIVKFRRCAVFLLSALVLGGCAWFRRAPEREVPAGAPEQAAVEPGRYIVTPERGADVVAELRIAPPPQTPEIADGTGIAADQGKANAKSFVRIGTGCHRDSDAAAREWVQRMALLHGAEKVFVYVLPADTTAAAKLAVEMTAACSSAAGPSPTALVATYYVRFKLPFGAQFRNLTADEKQKLGVGGGVQIGKVVDGTPASAANLRNGDFVLKFNGTAVRDLGDFRQMLRTNMGKRVTLTISRDGVQVDRMVRLGVLAAESRDAKK
ncbi:MAG: PDZ domain-containing protein [Proteobacteria bacterium]|uniref:PDZ domain-containing protein n=1 Tax=Rudaea sp. TaxID=2136325 RepID=UPI0032205A13|nr:PDZ domain-containing protein [Pseudomonadota bacterium]